MPTFRNCRVSWRHALVLAAALALDALPAIAQRAEGGTGTSASSLTPRAAFDELMDADRDFGSPAPSADLIGALSAMFAEDVVLAAGRAGFVRGIDSVVARMRTNPANQGARLEWAPLGGGISADARHGYTYGHATFHAADGTRQPQKYIAYWTRTAQGWRVAAYKRAPAPPGATPRDPVEPHLPAALVPVSDAADVQAANAASLDAAERAFSAAAQQIGLGAAFARFGTSYAVNLGGPDALSFVVGADAIGASIGAGSPDDSSPVWWEPEHVLVASSGDLGVTFGWIHFTEQADAAQPQPPVPFFTIWRRESPSDPWLYVAE